MKPLDLDYGTGKMSVELPDSSIVVRYGHTYQAHHHAYQESDGFDPAWASWYAPYLQSRLGDRLGRRVTRSELTYLLVKAQREHEAAGDATPWPDYYARSLLAG